MWSASSPPKEEGFFACSSLPTENVSLLELQVRLPIWRIPSSGKEDSPFGILPHKHRCILSTFRSGFAPCRCHNKVTFWLSPAVARTPAQTRKGGASNLFPVRRVFIRFLT